jgi:hypothetical protein
MERYALTFRRTQTISRRTRVSSPMAQKARPHGVTPFPCVLGYRTTVLWGSFPPYVYYEEIKWEIKRILTHECQCNERLKDKDEGSTRLGYTGLCGGLEHLKIRGEVKRREVWECEGWVCDLEVVDLVVYNYWKKVMGYFMKNMRSESDPPVSRIPCPSTPISCRSIVWEGVSTEQLKKKTVGLQKQKNLSSI